MRISCFRFTIGDMALVGAMFVVGSITTSCVSSDMNILGFDNVVEVSTEYTNIDREDLAHPEMISVNDSTMVILDFFGKQLFSSFDLNSGKQICRFGTLGEGPDEILLGTNGSLIGNRFVINNYRPFMVGSYDPWEGDGSLIRKTMESPANLRVSRMAQLSDSIWFSMGLYNDRFKYGLCHEGKGIVDSIGVSVFSEKEGLNSYHKSLAEQGQIAVSADRSRIVTTTNYSDNIDFIKFDGNKLSFIKQDHRRDAELSPEQIGEAFGMTPSVKAPLGFIDVGCNDKYVFALYALHSLEEDDYNSPYILVYDWNGNPVSAFDTKERVYALASNNRILYLLTKEEDDGFSIKKLDIEDNIR